jgi:hypothetical protein
MVASHTLGLMAERQVSDNLDVGQRKRGNPGLSGAFCEAATRYLLRLGIAKSSSFIPASE